jgi:hypothetical protein
MSFTPTNKPNLNQDNLTNQKNYIFNSNTENMKNNSNFLYDTNPEYTNNTINLNNHNNFFQNNNSNKNNIFNNLISSDINQKKYIDPNLQKMEPNEYQLIENPKVKFDDIISNMNNYINQYIYMGFFQNALFYAEKVFFLTLKREEEVVNLINMNNPNSNYNPIYQLNEQLYNFANCLFLNKEYFRCVNLIQKYNMTYYNIKFLNLLGQALFASEDYESVIQNLDKQNIEFIESKFLKLCFEFFVMKLKKLIS